MSTLGIDGGEPAVREAEAARLVAAGARVLETFDRHTIMSDPEGNEFCLTW